MKTITLLAVMALLLQSLFGTTSSVGGPLTDMLIVFVAMLAVAIQQAVLKQRSGLGWIVNIVASVIGGFVAVSLAAMAMEEMLSLLHFEGALAKSHHPLLYISEAGMAFLTVFGSWITLQMIYWLPDRNGGSRNTATAIGKGVARN